MARGEKKGKEKKLSNGYRIAAQHALAGLNPEARQQAANFFETNEDARAFYRGLRKEGVPPSTIGQVMAGGINEIAHGKEVNPGLYLSAVGQELQRYSQYKGVAKQMYEDGAISFRQYKELVEGLKGREKERLKHTNSALENIARVAVWLMISLGVILMLFSAKGVTGAVVGFSGTAASFSFVIGFILFVAGLFLKKN